MIAKGGISQSVQFPCFCISLDLTIPSRRIKVGEPPPELREFLSRQTRHFLLDGLKLTHSINSTTFSEFA